MLIAGRISYARACSLAPHPNYVKRKLIEFAPELWLALEMLAKDTGRSVQDLADEAFADLLGKYQRPASLEGSAARKRAPPSRQ